MAVIAYRVIVDHLLQALCKFCETGLWREKKDSHEGKQRGVAVYSYPWRVSTCRAQTIKGRPVRVAQINRMKC